MLSRFFNQQALSIFIAVFLLVSIGCASKTVDLARSQDHPADPNGKHGTTPTHGSMPTAEMHEGDEGHRQHRTLIRWNGSIDDNA